MGLRDLGLGQEIKALQLGLEQQRPHTTDKLCNVPGAGLGFRVSRGTVAKGGLRSQV